MGQMLSLPRPRSIMEVVEGLREVQLDPTAVVARTEHLVLWSRLGRRYSIAELERLLYHDRELFEYWVHIVPTADFALHRETMRRYPLGDWARHPYASFAIAGRFVLETWRTGPSSRGARAAGTTTGPATWG
jgi:uncharacterized protein YcaQ